jgi:hypothetical protein
MRMLTEDSAMVTYALYGVRIGRVEDVAAAVEARIPCVFQARNSYYFGSYRVAKLGEDELKIVSQPDPEGDPFEDDFADYQVLVYASFEGAEIALDGIVVGDGLVERLT